MEQREYLYEYNQLRSKMEKSGTKFGLTDQRTISLSQKLDLLLNDIMSSKCSKLNKQDQLG